MARFSGNRFGGGYGDSLTSKMLRNELLSKVRTRLGSPQMPSMAGGGGMPMGYGGQPGTMMSGGPSSAADTEAFNTGKKNRGLYGKYGKGGLMREEMRSGEKIQDSINTVNREELKSKYNTDTFEGEPLGPEHVKAQAEMEKAKALQTQARGGLLKQPKIHKVPGFDSSGDRFYQPGVDPKTGQPAMIQMPVHNPNAGLQAAAPKPKPKKKKDEGWASSWSSWLQ